MGLQRIWSPIAETFRDFSEDRVPRLSAALAYYTIFSLAPLLLIVIAVAGLIWGRQAVEGELVGQFSSMVGEAAGQQIQTMIANASQQAQGGTMLVVGIITMLFGAMGVFTQLKGALNTVWEVQLKSPGGWRGVWIFLRTYIISFAMIFVIAFLLLASLVASAALAAAGRWFANILPIPEWAMQVIDVVLSLGVITLLFASIYKILPDVRIEWRDVWAGAAITAALFVAGKFALGYYLGRSSVASVYGAAGSLIIILLWVYYSALIFLLGAEFTQVFAKRWGKQFQPKPWAEPVPGARQTSQRAESHRRGQAGREEISRRERVQDRRESVAERDYSADGDRQPRT